MPARAAPKQQTKTRQAIAIALTRHPLDECCHALVLPSITSIWFSEMTRASSLNRSLD